MLSGCLGGVAGGSRSSIQLTLLLRGRLSDRGDRVVGQFATLAGLSGRGGREVGEG